MRRHVGVRISSWLLRPRPQLPSLGCRRWPALPLCRAGNILFTLTNDSHFAPGRTGTRGILRSAKRFISSHLLFWAGLSYSLVNSAWSALSATITKFDGEPFGQHPVVCRILKGMYNRRPQRSRYCFMWDVDIVLLYLRELSPLKKLSLRETTCKLVLLMLLCTCQRVQTLGTLSISDIIWSDNQGTAAFQLSKLLKHSRRGSLGILILCSFLKDPRLCVVWTLGAYLEKTAEVRPSDEKALLITTTPPFRKASNATIARSTKDTMAKAGIDTSLFKAHSVRGASIHLQTFRTMCPGGGHNEKGLLAKRMYFQEILWERYITGGNRSTYAHKICQQKHLTVKSLGSLLIRLSGCSRWVCFDAPSANKGGLYSVDQSLSLLWLLYKAPSGAVLLQWRSFKISSVCHLAFRYRSIIKD